MQRILCALLAALTALALCACGAAQDSESGGQASLSWGELSFEETMPLRYAEQFSVSYAGEDYKFITIGQDQEFLLVAEGADVPNGVPETVTVLQQPLDEIYLVASAAMDSFARLNAVGCVRVSGRREYDWCIKKAQQAKRTGERLDPGRD